MSTSPTPPTPPTAPPVPHTEAPGEGEGRFAVVCNDAADFHVYLFDKQRQSDFVAKVTISNRTLAAFLIGRIISAWQLEGVVLTE